MSISETRRKTETILERIAWLSGKDSKKQFQSLMHLLNTESLKCCFEQLDGKKAVGIDGKTKEDYEINLEENLENLIEKMKRMAYIPQPVREVLIPKEGKQGATRPLGICVIEDKIVQKMMQKVLESIYEPIFLEFSYGFRPGRSCHDAIKDLTNHLFQNEVETVIDVDIANFFGTIDHKILEEMLCEKIQDSRFMRYIIRMFKAGVLSKGELTVGQEGVPQGSPCSPILANVFAHYVIDKWFEEMVKPNCRGTVKMIRYCDDQVICCQYHCDAIKIKTALGKRLEKFKLQLNEDKTKLVEFSKSKVQRGIKQGTFDFLGFTFYWGKSRRGRIIPKLRTRSKTLRSKLGRVKDWVKRNRNRIPLKELCDTFRRKLQGHNNYYGVSHNSSEIRKFFNQAIRIMFKWLNRRSQRKSFSWEKFSLFRKQYPLPRPQIYYKLF